MGVLFDYQTWCDTTRCPTTAVVLGPRFAAADGGPLSVFERGAAVFVGCGRGWRLAVAAFAADAEVEYLRRWRNLGDGGRQYRYDKCEVERGPPSGVADAYGFWRVRVDRAWFCDLQRHR